MTDHRSRRAIELNERLANGLATKEERSQFWLEANHASWEARQRIAYPEQASTLMFSTAAEAAELVLFPTGDWPLLQCGVHAAAAALAYEAVAKEDLPPSAAWPLEYDNEDQQAEAWAARYQSFQETPLFLHHYMAELALQAKLLRDAVGIPFVFQRQVKGSARLRNKSPIIKGAVCKEKGNKGGRGK